MTVNPELAILMRVIEDHQDKMPEGEYLAAMNALGALHRVAPVPADIPSGHPPAYFQPQSLLPVYGVAEAPNYRNHISLIEMMGRNDYLTWLRVKGKIPEQAHMTPEDWLALTQEQQNSLNREATLKMVESHEINHRNPDPKVCPFIARHAVGRWNLHNEHSTWTCACGYHGKSKNWKKHEESDRHKDWAKHRFVPRRTIEMMKSRIQRDEEGQILYFSLPLNGGIRYFLVSQERNEWTHPNIYSEFHREKNGNGTWFVHRREDGAHYYIE